MAAGGKVRFKVFRFDPDKDSQPHYDFFSVSLREGMTVLEGLFDILEKQDNSLAFRYSCRGAVCGSCAMFISGAYRLACQTQIARLKGEVITVSPLPRLGVIKDLVVDMAPFFEKYERIMPYLQAGTPPEKEYLQSPRQRKALNEVIDCILCGACYSACPMTWTNRDYLGPAALAKVYRFVADSRDEAAAERLRQVEDENGLWRCHTVFNCEEACPKKVRQPYAIQQLRRKTLTRRLKFR